MPNAPYKTFEQAADLIGGVNAVLFTGGEGYPSIQARVAELYKRAGKQYEPVVSTLPETITDWETWAKWQTGLVDVLKAFIERLCELNQVYRYGTIVYDLNNIRVKVGQDDWAGVHRVRLTVKQIFTAMRNHLSGLEEQPAPDGKVHTAPIHQERIVAAVTGKPVVPADSSLPVVSAELSQPKPKAQPVKPDNDEADYTARQMREASKPSAEEIAWIDPDGVPRFETAMELVKEYDKLSRQHTGLVRAVVEAAAETEKHQAAVDSIEIPLAGQISGELDEDGKKKFRNDDERKGELWQRLGANADYQASSAALRNAKAAYELAKLELDELESRLKDLRIEARLMEALYNFAASKG